MGLLSLDISKFPSASLSLSEIAIRKDYAGIISIKMKWNLLRECFLRVFYIIIWAPDLRLGEVNIMWILVLITATELFLSLSLWYLAIDQERASLLFWNMLSLRGCTFLANYLFTVALVSGVSALQQMKDEFC